MKYRAIQPVLQRRNNTQAYHNKRAAYAIGKFLQTIMQFLPNTLDVVATDHQGQFTLLGLAQDVMKEHRHFRQNQTPLGKVSF